MATSLHEIESLRQVLAQAYDTLIAEVASEPGYNHLTVDQLTRDPPPLAGSSERQSCVVAVRS